MKIGIIHPGAMGAKVAASAINSGCEVYWASAGRSEKTKQRAKDAGLTDIGSVKEMSSACDIILSVCPPHAALEVAHEVMGNSYTGLYVDGNAVSPERTKEVCAIIEGGGARFVDGGIIGGPPIKPDSTWLYLSGKEAQTIADCFKDGPLETVVMGDEIGKASAIKMCYAANTKGTTALRCAILAAAEKMGVLEDLLTQWSRKGSTLAEQAENSTRRVTQKAWRFAGEMNEIAATFEAAGLPGGFHLAAADIYQRISDLQDRDELPELEEVLRKLLKQ